MVFGLNLLVIIVKKKMKRKYLIIKNLKDIFVTGNAKEDFIQKKYLFGNGQPIKEQEKKVRLNKFITEITVKITPKILLI